MQQNNLSESNLNIAFFIGGAIINFIFLFGVYKSFERTAITAKLLAAGGSTLSLIILIPFWITVFKIIKEEWSKN